MSLNHLLFYFVLFIFFFYFCICANNKEEDIFNNVPKPECNNKSYQKFDRVMPLFLPVFAKNKIAETPTELRQWCNLVQHQYPFVLGYLRYCVSSFGQTVAKLMIFSIRKQTQAVCKNGKLNKQGREIIEAGKCANKAKQEQLECQNNMIDALVAIQKAPVRQRMSMMCCHAHSMRVCYREVTADVKGCTPHNIDWGEKWILGLFGGSISVVCGEYFDESDRCTKLMKETPKISTKSVHANTFFTPMIALMESLSEDNEN